MPIRWNERPVRTDWPPLPADADDTAAAPGSGASGSDPPGSDTPGADLWVSPAAEQVVRAHLGAIDIEQGGLLLGDAWSGPDGRIAHLRILAAVPADDSVGTGVSLRMEAAVWTRARESLQPGWRIIGWYHSHPGLTAFFSDTDRRTQRAVFPHPWSVGWVIDPFQTRAGPDQAFFLGPDSLPIPRRAGARLRAA